MITLRFSVHNKYLELSYWTSSLLLQKRQEIPTPTLHKLFCFFCCLKRGNDLALFDNHNMLPDCLTRLFDDQPLINARQRGILQDVWAINDPPLAFSFHEFSATCQDHITSRIFQTAFGDEYPCHFTTFSEQDQAAARTVWARPARLQSTMVQENPIHAHTPGRNDSQARLFKRLPSCF
jgi:hypothetical protein